LIEEDSYDIYQRELMNGGGLRNN